MDTLLENESIKDTIMQIYTDAASRGNLGNVACAFIFIRNGVVIHRGANYIGKATNNTAEYQAIINSLRTDIFLCTIILILIK